TITLQSNPQVTRHLSECRCCGAGEFMKAVVLDEYGGPEKLIYRESPVPACGDGEVLVKVKATSVNPIDYKLRSGAAKSFRPLEFPAILGRDLSGEVMKVG